MILGGTVVAGVVVFVLAFTGARSVSKASFGPSTIVERGELLVSVTEAGELEAERRKVISNELRWPVIIREVVAEGTTVELGQTIIEFECKELLDAITRKEIEVTQAEDSFIQAQKDLGLIRNETANALVKSKQKVIEAEQDLERYVKLQCDITRKEKLQKIELAKARLSLAEAKLKFMIKANEDPELEQPYSLNEIDAQSIEVNSLKLSCDKAESDMQILDKYAHPRKLQDYQTAISDAIMAYERANLTHENKIQMAESNVRTRKLTLKMRKDKLTEYREDEKKLNVKAEKSGLVVYDLGGRRWDNSVRVEVGARINQRQQLMLIPEMDTLQVKTKVYESVVNQVRPGIKAYIRLDAMPDLRLMGKVSKVSPLPASQHRWLNPGVKVFDVVVQFDDLTEELNLKPGMTAQVELILAILPDVLSVPVAAIFSEQERTYCYRVSGGQVTEARVKLGRMNDQRVEIASGLKQGDEVLLSPPDESIGYEIQMEDDTVQSAEESTDKNIADKPDKQTDKSTVQSSDKQSGGSTAQSSGKRSGRSPGQRRAGRPGRGRRGN